MNNNKNVRVPCSHKHIVYALPRLYTTLPHSEEILELQAREGGPHQIIQPHIPCTKRHARKSLIFLLNSARFILIGQ